MSEGSGEASLRPDRFSSAIAFYVAHRLPFPRRLLQRVTEAVRADPASPMLDLGCGPGFIALELAALGFGSVVGLDPDPGMIALAREARALRGLPVRFAPGSSDRLEEAPARIRLVTIGRAFHWMDRPRTLEALDARVEPGGAVVLLSEGGEGTAETPWRAVLKTVRARYAEEAPPHRKRHLGILLDSPFARLERISVVERHAIGVDAAVGRALSMSSTAPAALGDRLEAFVAELRAALMPLARDGSLTEIVEFAALIARRPADPGA